MQQVAKSQISEVQAKVSSSALVRFNPLSAGKLGFGAGLDGAWQELHRLQMFLNGQREQCCERLYQRIPSLPEPQKSFLIAFRRDLFNGRPLKPLPEGVLELLDPETQHHLQVYRRQQDLLNELQQEFLKRQQQEREALQGVCQNETFLKALTVSSPSMLEAAQAYARTPLPEHRSRIRKTEHSLLQFATRAALKTSPFSHYTALVGAVWEKEAPQTLPLPEVQATSTPHHIMVRRLLDAVLQHPEVLPLVQFQVNPRARLLDEQVVFEQRIDEKERQPRAHKVATRTIRLKKTPVMDLLMASSGTHTLAEWVDVLQVTPEKWDACLNYLNKLQEVGFLQPVVPIPSQTTDILMDLIAYLHTLKQTPAALLFEEVDQLTRTFAQAHSAERPRIQARLRHLWTEAYSLYGQTLPSGPLFYEDVSSPELLRLPEQDWQTVHQDLADLISVLRVYDTHLMFKPLVQQVFDAQCPSGRMDLETFLMQNPELFNDWLKLAMQGLTPELRKNPTIVQAQAIQKAFQTAYLQAARNQTPLRLDREQLKTWAQSMPAEWHKQDYAYGIFAQPARTENGLQIYINQMYQGHGQYFSRFLPGLHPEMHERVRSGAQEHFSEVMLVGLNSVYGFNANLHPTFTPFELDIDNTGDPTKVAFSDLELRRTADDLKVFHKGTGQEVQVLYSGFLISQILPPMESFLVTFCNSGLLTPYLLDAAQKLLQAENPNTVIHLPEVAFGQVVLARPRHVVPRSLIPMQEAQETDEAYFVRLNLWRQEHGLPARFFARALEEAKPASADLKSWQDRVMRGSVKPQYLDLDSALGVRYFAKWLRDSTHGFTFEPCLPEPGNTLMHSGEPHTLEILMEVTQGDRK